MRIHSFMSRLTPMCQATQEESDMSNIIKQANSDVVTCKLKLEKILINMSAKKNMMLSILSYTKNEIKKEFCEINKELG